MNPLRASAARLARCPEHPGDLGEQRDVMVRRDLLVSKKRGGEGEGEGQGPVRPI